MASGVEFACCFDDEGEDREEWLVGFFVDDGGCS